MPINLSLADSVRQRGRLIPIGAEEHGLLYRPALLAQANVLFVNPKYSLDEEMQTSTLVEEPERRGSVRWQDFQQEALDLRALDRRPDAQARFSTLEQPLADGRLMRTLKGDFVDWIYREIAAPVKANGTLGIYAGPNVDEKAFQRMCEEAAEDKQEAEVDKLDASYRRKIEVVQNRLTREERELREDEAAHSRSKSEEMSSYAETALGFFGIGRKKSISSALSKRSKSARAKEDVQESIEEIAGLKEDLAQLKAEFEAQLDEIEGKWAEIAADVTEISVSPYKKNIDVELFGVAWLPHYLLRVNDDFEEFPAFASAE